MKCLNIHHSPPETTHAGTVNVIRLLRSQHVSGSIGSMNYAWVDPGQTVVAHRHPDGEEYYLFLQGHGQLVIQDQVFSVQPGDFYQIPLNALHILHNTGDANLVFVSVRMVEGRITDSGQ